MLLFFFAFLFVFLDFRYNIGAATLNLIPDFVGYALIFIAARRYKEKSEHFRHITLLSVILFAWGVASFLLGAFAIKLHIALEVATSILSTLGALYLTYKFSEGVKEYETSFTRPIGAAQLSSAWVLLCMGNLIFFFTFVLESMYLVVILLQLLSLIWFEYSIIAVAQELRKRKRS